MDSYLWANIGINPLDVNEKRRFKGADEGRMIETLNELRWTVPTTYRGH